MSSETFTQEFESFIPQLKSYLLRLTTHRQDSEDLVHDTFVKAYENLDSFRGEASLKTWVFSIATNLAHNKYRKQQRWPVDVTDICKEAALNNPTFFQEAMHIRHNSPQGNFEIKEHIAFCFTCIGKTVPLGQQIALLLKEVYDFKVREIAIIMDRSEAMVKYYLHVGRSKMIEIFHQRCALINKEGICHQCTELNGIFNPKQKAEEELVKLELVRAADSADQRALLKLRMEVVKDIDPFESGAAELQLHHLEHNRQVMEAYLDKNPQLKKKK